jgi:hypothetical protein
MHLLRRLRHHRPAAGDGQALVEFAIVLVPFLILLIGIIDLGRAIYLSNGTSQAAREIARTTSVHPWGAGGELGTSSETQATIDVQRRLIPGLQITPATDITCVDPTDTVVPDDRCKSWSGYYIRVRVRAPFTPATPLLAPFGSHTFESYSRVQIP